MNIKQFLFHGLTALAFTATVQAGEKPVPSSAKKLLDPANMDTKVNPGDNFFMYANGTWLRDNPIPASETRWGSFNELQENNYAALHNLLEAAANTKNPEAGSATQKVGDFYKTGMNINAINGAGITPLKPLLSRIDAISSANSLMSEIATLHTMGVSELYGFYVSPDDKNVTRQIPQFSQGGLGMPDRDYYFNTDARTEKIRTAYQKYIVDMLRMIRVENPDRMAGEIFEMEKSLAGASMTRVEMRDPYKLYNKFSPEMLPVKMSGIDWSSTFKALKISQEGEVIIGQPDFFTAIGQLLKIIPLPVWKAYLKFHVVSDMAPYLSENFDNLRFDFYGKTVRGQQEQKPRWKRVLNVVDGSIGELLGQMYVDKNFKPEAKTRMLELVNNLQVTYADRINRLDWMSDATKKRALTKLNTFMKKIGYPDTWKSYGRLTIVSDSYVQNILAASAFEYDYNVGKLGRAVDKTEWVMTPPTVNAYYNPAFNEIVFPAGILQYPFFDFSADDAVNYGGIGAVIGHEMTHGFDDQGRQYDADGNLNDWWTADDALKFEEKAKVIVKQFNQYTVLDSLHVNGELTLGENLADLGGIAIAYEAFKKTVQGKSGKKMDGFTPDQRFFLSWAQVWRASTRPEETASRIVTDPHSPNIWRCNGPLSNFEAFYAAFDIKPGTKMYRKPADRAKVW